AESRLQAVTNFFHQNGLRAERSEERNRFQPAGSSDPGVVCQLRLDNDRELRDYFLLREMGEAFKPSRNTKSVIDDLERQFQPCKITGKS
ncbi:unnamed protein product, partial [Polarella glacialis]